MIVIRTPDQRLRIFISSTMKELASARAAARSAIERLRLIPVLFELGARPYPPARSLPRLSAAKRRLHWDLRAAVRVDRARPGDFWPGRRVPQGRWDAEARLRAVARAGP
jgi:hypothetical protein